MVIVQDSEPVDRVSTVKSRNAVKNKGDEDLTEQQQQQVNDQTTTI